MRSNPSPAQEIVNRLRAGERPSIPKPTVPQVMPVLERYYQIPETGLGGSIHVIIENPNWEQVFAENCLKSALAGEYHGTDADVFMAWLMTQLSTTQRHKLYDLHGYPWEDPAARDDFFDVADETLEAAGEN